MSNQIQPGPELNRLVGEKLFGYTIYHYNKDFNKKNNYYMLVDREFDEVAIDHGERKTESEAWADCPDFSGTWEGMRLVVEEMQRRGLSVVAMHNPDGSTTIHVSRNDFEVLGQARSSEAPYAVCMASLAALKALEADTHE